MPIVHPKPIYIFFKGLYKSIGSRIIADKSAFKTCSISTFVGLGYIIEVFSLILKVPPKDV